MTVGRTLCDEKDARVRELRLRLDAFYQTTGDYTAFGGISDHSDSWAHVRRAIEAVLRDRTPCRVLEVGAGRTGFARFLGPLRPQVHFTAQDVTGQNAAFLGAEADGVHVGDISTLETEFDVIFSTFVLEHVTNPRAHLEACFARLRSRGTLFIFSPRYDFPFYLSHSADHLRPLARIGLALKLIVLRLWTLLSGIPAFVVHIDPSVFKLPWSMDRDAVHWVSLFDLKKFFARRATIVPIRVYAGPGKDRFVKRCLQVAIAIQKK